MSNTLAREFNVFGLKGKKAFKDSSFFLLLNGIYGCLVYPTFIIYIIICFPNHQLNMQGWCSIVYSEDDVWSQVLGYEE